MLRPDKKSQRLSEQELRFLGAKNLGEVHVMEGQEAKQNRLKDQQERYLIKEACDFGDSLVRYIISHTGMSRAQLAWGTVLGLFCVRDEYPDGQERFDDLVDQGGADLVLSESTEVTDPGQAHDIVRGLAQFSDEELRVAADHAEKFAKYVTMKKRQIGLSNPQAAYGLGRAFHNLRRTFPREEGGSAAFDEYARRASDYFSTR